MASVGALGCAARDPGAGGVLTSCPAGPQPRPSSWQWGWPRMSCTLMQALGQVFAALVGLPGGYGAWVFQQLKHLHGILAGCFCASGCFTVPFSMPSMKVMAVEHWEAVSVCPSGFSTGGDLVARPITVWETAQAT